jgi:hypothetical protein
MVGLGIWELIVLGAVAAGVIVVVVAVIVALSFARK